MKLSDYAKKAGVSYQTACCSRVYGLRRSKRKREKIIAELKESS